MNVKANVFPMQYVLTPKRDSQIHVFCVFERKMSKKVWSFKKYQYLCTRISTETELQQGIGVWCNGNTTDSGPVILGSSPSTPTFQNAKLLIIRA